MKQVFINIPVSDLEKSTLFYLALGFTINPKFTFENQKCMVWSDAIFIMLQSKQFFNTHLNKPLVDPKKFETPSHTLPVESIQKVNELIESGLKAGGLEPIPTIDEGFMYLRSIEDLDGYLWGIMYLDEEKFKAFKNVGVNSESK